MDVFSLSDELAVGAVCVRDNTGVGGSLSAGLGTGQKTNEAKSS